MTCPMLAVTAFMTKYRTSSYSMYSWKREIRSEASSWVGSKPSTTTWQRVREGKQRVSLTAPEQRVRQLRAQELVCYQVTHRREFSVLQLTLRRSHGKVKVPFHSILISGYCASNSTNFMSVQSANSFKKNQKATSQKKKKKNHT